MEEASRLGGVAGVEVGEAKGCLVAGHGRVVCGHLGHERNELSESALLPSGDHELGAVEREGVGLAAVGADLHGAGRQLLGPVGVTGHQGVGGLVKGGGPPHGRLLEPFAERLDRGKTSGRRLEVTGLHGDHVSVVRCPVPVDGVAARLRRLERLWAFAHPLFVEGRDVEGGQVNVVENLCQYSGVAEPSGHRCGFVGESASAVEGAVGELVTEGGEQQRPVGAVSGGRRRQRSVEHRHPVGVDDAEGAEASVVGEGCRHQPVGDAELLGAPGGIEQGRPEGRDARLSLGDSQPQQQVGVEQGFGFLQLGGELQGVGEVANGVVGGQGCHRRFGGLAGIGDGLGGIDRLGRA